MPRVSFWIVVGFFGQALFTARFLVQWIASERNGRSLVSDRVQQAMPPDLPAEDVVVSGFFGSIGLYEEPTPAMYQAVTEVMQRLDLEHLSCRLLGDLSFGEARRLLQARALVHKPRLLLLD